MAHETQNVKAYGLEFKQRGLDVLPPEQVTHMTDLLSTTAGDIPFLGKNLKLTLVRRLGLLLLKLL